MQTIMIGLSLEVHLNLHVIHADANNCFNANCTLDPAHRITIKTPQGMKIPAGHTLVLNNAIQGSPQASRIWQDLANDFLLQECHFRQSIIDPCYYWKRIDGKFIQIVRMTDDFRIGAEDEHHAEEVYQQLATKWKFKRQPSSKSWCGMHLTHDRIEGTLTICMRQEIDVLLERFGMTECTPVATPADPATKLSKPTCPLEDSPFDYRGAAGCFLWFARTGRPEVMYATNQVSQFVSGFDNTHITAAKRILRYFKGTRDIKKILRRGDRLHMNAMVDADLGGEPEDNEYPLRSLAALVITLVGIGVILASVILERTLSLSTCEAEYKAVSKGAQVLVGYRQFFTEIGFADQSPSTIYSDNQAAIALAKQSSSNSSTRHMKLKFHYVREQLMEREIELEFCPTLKMIADILTKALERGPFERFRRVLLTGVDEDGVVY
jgi:hypothetical protein